MTRRHLLTLAAAVLAAPALPRRLAGQDVSPLDFSTLARRRAMEAARRLGAEGWRIRDHLLAHPVKPARPLLCPVHLIGGVQYLFLAAVRPLECRLRLRLLDEDGLPLAPLLPEGETRLSAVWHEPEATARAQLELTVPRDAAPGEVAALYVYR